MVTDQPENLQGEHEETDTLVALHASTTVESIIVRAPDTDIVVILLSLLGRMAEEERRKRCITLHFECG